MRIKQDKRDNSYWREGKKLRQEKMYMMAERQRRRQQQRADGGWMP